MNKTVKIILGIAVSRALIYVLKFFKDSNAKEVIDYKNIHVAEKWKQPKNQSKQLFSDKHSRKYQSLNSNDKLNVSKNVWG